MDNSSSSILLCLLMSIVLHCPCLPSEKGKLMMSCSLYGIGSMCAKKSLERIAKGDRDLKVQVLRNPRIALAFSGSHMEAMHEPMPSSQAASCIYAAACPRSKPSAVEAMSAIRRGC